MRPEFIEHEPVVIDAADQLVLKIEQDNAAEFVERLRETHADSMGRAYLLRLDILIDKLGPRWPLKKDLVFNHLKTSFERKFPEPNWCTVFNEDCFLAVILTLGEHKGALSAAELWFSTRQFFVGDVSDTRPPLYEARAEDVDRLRLIPIDLSKYFDRAEARPFRAEFAPLPKPPTELYTRAPAPSPVMTPMAGRTAPGAMVVLGGRNIRIACAVEPVFEMKKLSLIGHRFEPVVAEAVGNVSIDAKALAAMDWGDREQVDLANAEQGIRLMQMRAPAQRKILMVIPAAFSTFANARARGKLTLAVSRAAQAMGLKVLFEIRDLNGVPQGRVTEVVSLLKPYCMTVMGHAGPEPRAITGMKGCGLSGACIDFDGARRDDTALELYLTALSTAARGALGACMIHGFDNLHQMAVARLSGVSHASVKASALMASRA